MIVIGGVMIGVVGFYIASILIASGQQPNFADPGTTGCDRLCHRDLVGAS
jgi:hypothetical protein